MPENLASFKVFCQGGLNTSRDVLSQGENQPGSAVSLINYEPAVTGGYRKINGFEISQKTSDQLVHLHE